MYAVIYVENQLCPNSNPRLNETSLATIWGTPRHHPGPGFFSDLEGQCVGIRCSFGYKRTHLSDNNSKTSGWSTAVEGPSFELE